jgi:hypothetical protein
MKGAGEPVLEDFDDATDVMGEIFSAPDPGLRMELELATRLYGYQNEPTEKEDQESHAEERDGRQPMAV